jgi:molecular chaperone GrpE
LTPRPGKRPEAAPPSQPPDFFDQLRSQVEELSKEKELSERKADEYLDRLKRLQADIENLQKITKRQIDTVTRQASESLVVKLFPVLDSLQQASNVNSSNKSLSSEEVSVGLKMLFNQLIDVLKTEGLEEVPCMGEHLNPEKHEVVSYVETDKVPENTIVEEVRRGYAIRGTIIRPSLVVVSKRKSVKDQGLETAETG